MLNLHAAVHHHFQPRRFRASPPLLRGSRPVASRSPSRPAAIASSTIAGTADGLAKNIHHSTPPGIVASATDTTSAPAPPSRADSPESPHTLPRADKSPRNGWDGTDSKTAPPSRSAGTSPESAAVPAGVVANAPGFTGEPPPTPSCTSPAKGIAQCSPARLQCLVQIPENIVDLFHSYRKPDQTRRRSPPPALLFRQLLMRRRRRMNHQALGVARYSPGARTAAALR